MTSNPVPALSENRLGPSARQPTDSAKTHNTKFPPKPYPKLHAFRFDFRPIQRQPTDADDHHSTPLVSTPFPPTFSFADSSR